MKHQYSTDGFLKKSLQWLTDTIVDAYVIIFSNKQEYKEYPEPRSILFITLGHLGDALILSYVFPLIHSRYPNAHIDVLTGEWSKPILVTNPYVRKIIIYNHFRQNRAEISFLKKIKDQINSSRAALKIIRSQNYDISIEGRISHPNGNLLCYRGKVNRRIGFGSGGFGSLLTDEISFPERTNFHMLEAILCELQKIGINKTFTTIIPYFYTPREIAPKEHPLKALFNIAFIILNPETGKKVSLNRSMSKEFWLKIIQNILNNTNYHIVICGTSQKSNGLFDYISLHLPKSKNRIVNAVQKLSLEEFFLLSKYSKVALTLDSLAAHMCTINCHTISFYKNCIGTLFFPIPNKKAFIIHNTFLSRDSEIHPNIRTSFIKDIESEDTYELVKEIITKLF